MEQYLAIKRNKLLIDTTLWMNFQGVILSEKSNLKSSYTI